MKTRKHIEIFDEEQGNKNFPPNNFEKFVQWANDLLEKIPPECRQSAMITIDCVRRWENYIYIEVSYYKDLTDAEIEEEKKKEIEERNNMKLYTALPDSFEKTTKCPYCGSDELEDLTRTAGICHACGKYHSLQVPQRAELSRKILARIK